MSWFGIGATVVSAGASIYSNKQQQKAANKALDSQRGIADNLKYEPIDINKLKADATAAAIDNAAGSLEIERSLTPDIADTRSELARQVNADLKAGGNLPADVVNQVNMAGRVAGARSNVGAGGTVPLTASLIGLSSLDLINQRRQAASNLLNANPLPVAGLDPGQLASVEIANNAAMNDFNAAKAGVSSNLAESEAAARSAQIGGQAGLISTLGNLAGKIGSAYSAQPKSSYEDLLKKIPKTGNQNPSTNLFMANGPVALA